MLFVVLGVLLLLAGLLLAGVGAAGLTARLPRNRWAGVRTPATLATDTAFRLANRVAGPGVLTAGGLLAVGGVVALGVDGAARTTVVALCVLGAGTLAAVGGSLGARAAAVAQPAAAPHARCADCTGCELMDSLKA